MPKLTAANPLDLVGTYFVHPRTGRLIPPIAGADPSTDQDDDADDVDDVDDTDAGDDDAAGAAGDDDTDDDTGAGDGDGDGDDDGEEDELPDGVKEVLRKERQRRRKAEKENRRLRRASKPKPKPKPKPPADDAGDDEGRDVPDQSVVKLRRANLRMALAEKGYDTSRARAVVRLLDDVEYDDDDEPVNLDDALEEAEEEYGADLVRPEPRKRPRPPKIDGKDGAGGAKPPNLTADELAAAEAAGKTPEEWESLKSVKTLDDWTALEKKRRDAAK